MVTDYSKQTELINVYDVFSNINVIGCGALGSWIVFYLLKMGFKNISVYDFDTVEEHNLPNQMFRECDIGSTKVESMNNIYNTFFDDENCRINCYEKKVTMMDVLKMDGILISAVDSMATRKMLFEGFKKNRKLHLFIEGRLSIYGAYVYTITRNTDYEKYEATLYDDTEAEVSACGVSQTALPAAVNASSIMIMQMIQFIKGEPVNNKVEYSIPWLDTMKGVWSK